MLLWTEMPSKESASVLYIGPQKFLCGRKGKYGINLQAVCDHERRFLVFSMANPGAALDYMSILNITFFEQLSSKTDPLQEEGLFIFGDNAYVNQLYITVPFPNAKRTENNFNYYYFQV